MERGQTSIEYLFVLVMMVSILFVFFSDFSDLMGNQTGRLNHMVAQFLSTGVCPRECFFGNFGNGHQ